MILKPLPGISYLATSPTYFEMMQKKKNSKKGKL